MNHSLFKNKRRPNKILQLEKDIEYLDNKSPGNNDTNLLFKRKNLQSELNELYKENTEAAYVRSRAKWIEQGEKNTSYFLNLEKHHQNNNCITKLVDEQGNTAQNDESILNQIKDFTKNCTQVKHRNSPTLLIILPKSILIKY